MKSPAPPTAAPHQSLRLLATLVLCVSSSSCAFWRSTRPVDLPAPIEHATASGVRYQDTYPGVGERTVAWGSTVGVHYVGRFADGTQFDSSYERGKPMRITVGERQVVPGWEEGLIGMRQGGQRVLTIPPEQAYGAQGRNGIIPPDATLVLEIELLWIAAQE